MNSYVGCRGMMPREGEGTRPRSRIVLLMIAGVGALLVVAVVAVAVTLLVVRNDSDNAVPELSGPDASLIAQVDCGDDGVAAIHVQYGQVDKTTLIGRNSVTRGAGGLDNFDEGYGLADGFEDVRFTIITTPTRGTCTTVLTDRNSGDVVAEKKSAGTVRLEAILGT